MSEGITIRLYLPRHVAQEDSFIAGETTVTSSIRGTVLLVDDDETVRTLIASTLRDHGLTVLEAEDGTLALHILQSSARIDLLLSDIGLPGISGRQLAEVALRERPDMPVMLITGYAGKPLREGALPEGAELILKPFSLPILLARVSNALAEARR